MKCSVCGFEDKLVKSNFCEACGKEFTDEERKEAYSRTIYGKIDKALDAKEWLTLSKITDNVFVRIAILLILAALVVVNVTANGSELALRNGDDYSLAYCKETDEYYVLTDKESVALSVYLPKKTKSCVLETYVDGSLDGSVELSGNDPVIVKCMENGYFLLKAEYENGKSEEILFFVCPEVES